MAWHSRALSDEEDELGSGVRYNYKNGHGPR